MKKTIVTYECNVCGDQTTHPSDIYSIVDIKTKFTVHHADNSNKVHICKQCYGSFRAWFKPLLTD